MSVKRGLIPVALFLLQCYCLFSVARVDGLSGLPLDDAWIHQVIARNFGEHGELGFAPGKFGSAATSLLWPVLLSVPFSFGFEIPVQFSFFLNALFYLGAGYLVLRLLLNSGIDPWLALVGAMTFSAAGNFVWFAFSGMEAMLVVFLICALVVSWDEGRSKQRFLIPALLTTLLVFTRTETGFAAALIILFELARHGVSAFSRVSRYAVAAGIGVAGLLSLNVVMTGHLLPPTLEGRRWMWLLPLQGATPADLVSVFLFRWVDRLSEFTLGLENPWLFWISLGIALFGIVELWRTSSSGLRILLLAGGGHLCVYALLLPVEGHGGRYQPLTPALFSLALSFGVVRCSEAVWRTLGVWRNFSRYFGLGVGAIIVFVLAQMAWHWGDLHADAVRHIEISEVSMGRFVASLPSDAKVASFDIGGIGYFGRRELVDLGALSDPVVLKDIKAGKVYDYLIKEAVTHVVVPQSYGEDFVDPWNYLHILRLDFYSRTGGLQRIHVTATPVTIWRTGLRATLHSAPRQVAYAVERGVE